MWQAKLCVLLCNYEIASTKLCCDFWSVDLILLLVALVELLRLVDAFFIIYEDYFVVCV
jgi:hypothetical protein